MNGNAAYSPIGVFDSGYGGLTILKEIRALLPQYDYLYLGDNARTPYGSRSFEVVYQYTLQAVHALFDMGCPLVILACNTASAKALRTIQQHDLPSIDQTRRVLGVIRPSAEAVGSVTRSRTVGILATQGTVMSESYRLEIKKLFPDILTIQQSCPLWVPLVENGEHTGPGADYFVKKNIDELFAQNSRIDTVILGCTHYPLLIDKIRAALPPDITILTQGGIVAQSLTSYMQRHPEMATRCSKGGSSRFFTSEDPQLFSRLAGMFMGSSVAVEHLSLG